MSGPGPAPRIFVVRRAGNLRVFGGFFAFPGGKVAPEDSGLLPQAYGIPPWLAPERRVAAVRELFEETGVLLARHRDGTFPPPTPDWPRLRRLQLNGSLTLREVLTRLDLTVQLTDLTPVGAFVTPPFSPQRFDTTFFLATLPPQQLAEVSVGELEEGRWCTPVEALEQWQRGECLLTPPTVAILQAIRDCLTRDIAPRFAQLLPPRGEGVLPPIFFGPDVQLLPLHTQSLPPTNYTSAVLIGRDPAYLIDPGTGDAREQQKLFAALDVQQAAGRRIAAVVLTHHHPDHVGAANACARRSGGPVWAHALTAQALKDKVAVDRELADGDRLDLGTAASGRPWHLEAVHTPGHAPGHLIFHEPHYGVLIAGDMVSTLTSVVIAPPEGDLAQYLESLRRMQQIECRLLIPAHGSPTARPRQFLEECVTHRAVREDQLRTALGPNPRTVAELAEEMYQGLSTELMRLAELQTLAGLQKLEREGRARDCGKAGWCRG
jgi:glyoxylase-like metal-dependent hydrolase (beta-lactamase superfamily II)/8-oxo-dGTP pyrophosphatase MutT (NUDIX family)